MDMEAGPSRIYEDSIFFDSEEEEDDEDEDEDEDEYEYDDDYEYEYVELDYVREQGITDLDEFLENYPVNSRCLLQILSYLNFDEFGYSRPENAAEESLDDNLSVKRIYPSEGFCVRAVTLEGCVVFINICHCDDIQSPSNALLDTLLNMSDDPDIVDLPLSVGKPHRERNDDGRICLAFDIILNTRFYEQQVNKYELLRAYILLLCITGINDKYYSTIQPDSCVKMGRIYHGTMPKQFIDRKLSAFIEDQVMVKVYTQAKAAHLLKWAKTSEMKRLKRLRKYKQPRKFRAPLRLSARKKPAASKESKPSTFGMRTRSCKSPPNEPSTSLQTVFPPIEKNEIDSLRGMEYFDMDGIDSLREMEYLDMDGIVGIGIHVESDHLEYPTLLPPGSRDDSMELLYRLEENQVGYNLEYELFQLCDKDQLEYLVITELPPDTNLEDIAIFASRDGLIVTDKDAKPYFSIILPCIMLPKRIKITANCLTMTICIPYKPKEEDQEVPNLSD